MRRLRRARARLRLGLLWKASLVGAQVLAGGAAFSGVVGDKPAGLAVLIIAALQAGTTYYEHSGSTAAEPQDPQV